MRETLPRGRVIWHPVSKDPPINESDNRFFLWMFAVIVCIGVIGFVIALT